MFKHFFNYFIVFSSRDPKTKTILKSLSNNFENFIRLQDDTQRTNRVINSSHGIVIFASNPLLPGLIRKQQTTMIHCSAQSESTKISAQTRIPLFKKKKKNHMNYYIIRVYCAYSRTLFTQVSGCVYALSPTITVLNFRVPSKRVQCFVTFSWKFLKTNKQTPRYILRPASSFATINAEYWRDTIDSIIYCIICRRKPEFSTNV